MFLEQPQGNLVLAREDSAAFKSDITVDALMQKAADALGGESNLRKHRSLSVRFKSRYDEQGVSGTGDILHAAPNKIVEVETLSAARRRIASTRDYCDGKNSGMELSFSSPSTRSGSSLADSLVASDFYAPLNWKAAYKSVSIMGEGMLDGEQCYIVEKKPEKGSTVKDHYSKSTFLLLKREGPGPLSETFHDYRPVDGVMIPFKRIRQNPLTGPGVLTVTYARFDAIIAQSAFAPREIQSKTQPDQRIPIARTFD